MDNIMNEQGESKVSNEETKAGQNLYDDSNRGISMSLTKLDSGAPMQGIKPDGYSTLPPFLLDEIAKRTGDTAFATAAKDASEMQSNGDTVRPRIETNMNGDREVYDAQTKTTLPGVKVRSEGEGPSGNTQADKAFDFTGFVRDFYKKEYGRDSIDGKGMKFVSTVNYGNNYENAFWNGRQMTYGKPGPNSPFADFVLLDVAGHEITHGVTEKESGMTYYGQSGALNESMSDIFGEMIEQYSKNQTVDQADWLIGNGIWKDNVKGKALRDMMNPGTAYDDPKVGKDPQPAHMKDYKKTWNDNGGVHYNSGIPNRAFALFATAVGGNAWDDAGHVFYNARKTAGNNPSFASFAFETLEAAKAMNKPGLVEKLQTAWETVGVTPVKGAKDTDTPIAPEAAAKKTAA